jgi:phosphoribosylglycinamide formyltransferase 1
MSKKKRTAILISGRGSNMRSLVEAARTADYPAEIVVVVSNRPNAAGVAWAVEQGLPTVVIDHKSYATRAGFERALQSALDTHDVELVALAGFMRLMTPEFVEHWRDRMINIHPSLLPSFKGLNTHEQAIAAGVRIAGCTVHFVRAEMDDGPIIAQAAIPVLGSDTPETLAARILKVEHRVYPAALRLVAAGEACCDGEKVVISSQVSEADCLVSPTI